jgi:hypothetical protein
MGWSDSFETKAVAKVVKKAQQASRAVAAPPQVEMAKVDWAHLVAIDFETYFDDEYSLRRAGTSTSDYVRDARFKAQMMGVKVGKKKRVVIPHAKIAAYLKTIDWTCHDLLCHNTAFDGLILSHHYGVVPRRYYDTLSMARGLHSNDINAGLNDVALYYGVGNKTPDVLDQSKGVLKLSGQLYKDMAAYCGVDVDLTLEIFWLMAAKYPEKEMQLIDITIRMFCDPVLEIDRPRVEVELAREIKEKEDLLISIVAKGHNYDEKELLKTKAERALEGKERTILMAKRIVGSGEKFAQLLRDEGVEPGTKISPAWIKKKPAEREDAKKYSYAFAKDDEFMLELLASDDQRLRDLAECRISVKSTTNITRAQRFLDACENGWKLPVGLSYARAHTLRWGGNNKMNMQNLKRGGELRQSILAPKGHAVVVADSGQIEARVNGWLWGQQDLLDAFYNADKKIGKDAYCNFADLIYGRNITPADKMERFVGKVCVLGLGFQMGAAKLQGTLARGALGGPPVFFDLNHCHKIVNTYRTKNYKIRDGWKICGQIIEDMAAGRSGSHKCLSWDFETIYLPNGLTLKYPNLRCEKNEDSGWDEWTYEAAGKVKKLYGGLLCENIVQCLARIIVAEQMLMVAEKKHRLVMMTHDEIVAIARLRSADKCFADMMKAMTTPLWWCPDLPLNAEGGHAVNYSK